MRNIEKALKLYSLMAARCEKSGYSPRQAQVYREMVDFMQDCETANEAMEKIKNSAYFLAPSAALVQDKLAALEKASRECFMPDVADVYRNKIEQIDRDVAAMYESGYEATIKNLKKEYFDTYNAFVQIFEAYFKISCCSIFDKVQIDSALNSIKKNLSMLSKPTADFKQLASLKHIRDLLPITDEGYERFVREVLLIAENGTNFEEEQKTILQEAKELKELCKNEKQTIIAAGNAIKQKMKMSLTTAVPPDSNTGCYTFINEKIINY